MNRTWLKRANNGRFRQTVVRSFWHDVYPHI